MAFYRIKRVINPMDMKYGRGEYIAAVKQRMIRDLAEKMFEVFGDMRPKNDMLTNDQYLEFTLNSWEDYEVEKAEKRSFEKGFQSGAEQERDKWQSRIVELEKQLEEKDQS